MNKFLNFSLTMALATCCANTGIVLASGEEQRPMVSKNTNKNHIRLTTIVEYAIEELKALKEALKEALEVFMEAGRKVEEAHIKKASEETLKRLIEKRDAACEAYSFLRFDIPERERHIIGG